MTLDPLPDAWSIERLGAVMAASQGLFWPGLSLEVKSDYRVMANAALMSLGTQGHDRGLNRLKRVIEDAAGAARQAADLLAKMGETQQTRLHRAASNLDALMIILEGAPEEAPEEVV